MSNATVLQSAANRFSKVAGFTPIAVDGQIGSKTLAAVQRALDYVSVIDETSGVSEMVSSQAAAWAAQARTTSTLTTNAQPIGGFLVFAADLLKLGFVASPVVAVPAGSGGGAASSGGIVALPVFTPSTTGAGILDSFKALPAWQKILIGAIAGLGAFWLWGRYKHSRGLAGLGTSQRLHLYTYRNKHGSYSDVWARDAEHAHEQIKRKKDRPGGFFTLSRVTNVPSREIA